MFSDGPVFFVLVLQGPYLSALTLSEIIQLHYSWNQQTIPWKFLTRETINPGKYCGTELSRFCTLYRGKQVSMQDTSLC